MANVSYAKAVAIIHTHINASAAEYVSTSILPIYISCTHTVFLFFIKISYLCRLFRIPQRPAAVCLCVRSSIRWRLNANTTPQKENSETMSKKSSNDQKRSESGRCFSYRLVLIRLCRVPCDKTKQRRKEMPEKGQRRIKKKDEAIYVPLQT